MLAIAENKKACRRHLTGPIPEARHLFPSVAKYEEGPDLEGRVAALLVTEKHNVYYVYRHAARAAREPGGRGTLVFGLDCAELNEEEVQGHFKAAIKELQPARSRDKTPLTPDLNLNFMHFTA